MPERERRCETCKFWDDKDAARFTVERSSTPPSVRVVETGVMICRRGPQTVPKWGWEWCGEWKAKEPEKNGGGLPEGQARGQKQAPMQKSCQK